jgi:hypothetical protein
VGTGEDVAAEEVPATTAVAAAPTGAQTRTPEAAVPVKAAAATEAAVLLDVRHKAELLGDAVKAYYTAGQSDYDIDSSTVEVARIMCARTQTALHLPSLFSGEPGDMLRAGLDGDHAAWGTLFSLALLLDLGKVVRRDNYLEQTRTWLDEWLLGAATVQALRDFGVDAQQAEDAVTTIGIVLTYPSLLADAAAPQDAPTETQEPRRDAAWRELFNDRDAQRLLGVNSYDGVFWFNQESFDQLLWWLFATHLINEATDAAEISQTAAGAWLNSVQRLRQAARDASFSVAAFLQILARDGAAPATDGASTSPTAEQNGSAPAPLSQVQDP